MTSGPVAFFLATDHGTSFAGQAAVGMLAGTISQDAFALAYRGVALTDGGLGSPPAPLSSPPAPREA